MSRLSKEARTEINRQASSVASVWYEKRKRDLRRRHGAKLNLARAVAKDELRAFYERYRDRLIRERIRFGYP